jgi:predicted RNA-binding Zn-ribbon protein involved in translation (DUF1610 family)
MPKSEIFRVNYFVAGMLAQGGNVWLDDSKIVFSPTSALDRAMGAKDVEIPFPQIHGLAFKGDLLRTFIIQTTDRHHKFEGSQAKKVWELLNRALKIDGILPALPAVQTPAPAPAPPAAPALAPRQTPLFSPLTCDHCAKPLEPGYSFCPSCGTRVKSVCSSCRRAIVSTWAACAWCGWKFSPSGGQGK